MVWTPLKNISQLGWLFPIYGKIKNVPNHQPDMIIQCSSVCLTIVNNHKIPQETSISPPWTPLLDAAAKEQRGTEPDSSCVNPAFGTGEKRWCSVQSPSMIPLNPGLSGFPLDSEIMFNDYSMVYWVVESPNSSSTNRGLGHTVAWVPWADCQGQGGNSRGIRADIMGYQSRWCWDDLLDLDTNETSGQV